MKQTRIFIFAFMILTILMVMVNCARPGSPDGGWYDEKEPRVIRTTPNDRGVNVKQQKINILFDEFIKVENPSENIIISPPQIETPDIKASGKSIIVQLKDSLKENTTYTVDFSNAITDNNENNPLGNYTYSFSTGEEIDTLEVGGYVLDAETLEPLAGVLVGLYVATDTPGNKVPADSVSESDSLQLALDYKDMVIDTTFITTPFLRVSRTDQSGHFVVKGVKQGKYKVYALKDLDNNFMYTPNSGETIAFTDEVITPSFYADTRQDTIFADTLGRISSIDIIGYTHFTPDNLMLMAFSEARTERAFSTVERKEAEFFTLFFSYGDSILPKLKLLDSDIENPFLIDASEKKDTLICWLTDTSLVNTDTLMVEMQYRFTDSTGVLRDTLETLEIGCRTPYAKRLKAQQEEFEKWEKQQKKNKKKGMPYDSIMPPKFLEPKITMSKEAVPGDKITIEFPTPLASIDSTKIRLLVERDSINWYNVPFDIHLKPHTNIRTYEIVTKNPWEPEVKYSFEIDSLAFTDIYGLQSDDKTTGIIGADVNKFGTLNVRVPAVKGKAAIVQLVDEGEKLVKEVFTKTGEAVFRYISPKIYYLKMIVDHNDNHVWDAGNFATLEQADEVYFYPKEIEIEEKRTETIDDWNLQKPRNEQKPKKLVKAKGEKKKQKQDRNRKRAEDNGLSYDDYLKLVKIEEAKIEKKIQHYNKKNKQE